MLRPSRGQSGGRTVRRAGGRLDFGLRRGLHAKAQSLSVAIVRYGVRVGRFGAARGIWFNLLDLCRNQIRRQANPRDLHPCSHLFHPTQPHPTPARNTTPLEPTSPTPTPRHSTLHTHTHTRTLTHMHPHSHTPPSPPPPPPPPSHPTRSLLPDVHHPGVSVGVCVDVKSAPRPEGRRDTSGTTTSSTSPA